MNLIISLLPILAAVNCVISAPVWDRYLTNIHVIPPLGAVVVAQDGRPGVHPNITAGVNALPTNETGEQYLFIYPGLYKEQVVSSVKPLISSLR